MSEDKGFPGWYCVDSQCDKVLGHIVGGELHVSDRVDPSSIRSRGNGLIIECPECGTKKIWYSSSPLVRSLEQFLETMAELIARRALNIIHTELRDREDLLGEGSIEELIEKTSERVILSIAEDTGE